MHTPRKLLAGAGIVAMSAGLLATPASAHVSIQEGDQVAGAYTVLTFGVPHACDGSPTTEVAISIPESILDVTPTRNAYYDVAITTEALPEPVEGAHGEEITERESVVTYTSKDPLADGFRDALQISLQIPEDAADTTLYFPTVQTCEEGETAWIEIPEDGQDPHSLESPSPAVNVIAAEDDGHGHGDDADHADDTEDDAEAAEGEQASTETDDAADDITADDEVAAPVTDDDGTDGLTIVALVLGALGVAVGGAGFAAARKKS